MNIKTYTQDELNRLAAYIDRGTLSQCQSMVPDGNSYDYYKGMHDAFHLATEALTETKFNDVSTFKKVLMNVLISFLIASRKCMDE